MNSKTNSSLFQSLSYLDKKSLLQIGVIQQYTVLSIIFGIGFFGYLMHALDWFKAIPGDLGDARFNSVILEHVYQWLSGNVASLWSPKFFYPFKGVLAFSDNHFGSDWVYTLFRLFGLPRELAYVGWFAVGTSLNYWAAYYALRKFNFSIIAAGIGAFVYAFSLPALSKEGHAQLVYRFAAPLAFLEFYRFLISSRPYSLSKSSFWICFQFYCSIYVGLFLIYFFITTTVVSILYKRENLFHGWRKSWKEISKQETLISTLIFLFSILSVLWLLYQYKLLTAPYKFIRSKQEIFDLLPRLSSYLIADQSSLSSWVGSWVTDIPMRHEHQMFIGIGVSLLSIFGISFVWIYRGVHRDMGRLISLSLLLLLLSTLAIKTSSIYEYIMVLPGINSVRAVTRIILVILLPCSIFVAICVDTFLFGIRDIRKKWVVIFCILVLITAESVFFKSNNTPIHVWEERQNQLIKSIKAPPLKNSILFVLPRDDEPFYQTELDAMILAQDLGVATLNGYSGNIPPNFELLRKCLPFESRLNSYFHGDNLNIENKASLASRVLIIEQTPCPKLPVSLNNGSIN